MGVPFLDCKSEILDDLHHFAADALLRLVGERSERCLWQKKRGERVAAVKFSSKKREPRRKFGNRNRALRRTAQKRKHP